MFRVTFMCKDAQLAKALHALVGVAVEAPTIQPVSNAVVKNKKTQARVPGTNLVELIKNKLIGDDTTKVTWPELRVIVTKLGYQPISTNSAVAILCKQQFLKRTSRGQYAVLH